MVSDRYNDVLICVSPGIFKSIIKTGQYTDSIIGISVRSEQDPDKLQEIIKEIFSLKTGKVCLWIDEKIYREHEQKISRLLFVLYSIGYLFNHGKAVIYFVRNHSEHDSSSSEALSNSVSSLGFISYINEVESWTLSGVNNHKWFLQADNDLISKEQLCSSYFDLLTRDFFVDQDICIFSSDEKKIQDILETIFEVEKMVFQSNPGLHEFFHRYRYLTKEQERLMNDNKQLEIDLANQKKYLAVLRQEMEMEKIIEFYHREYEVLPLWYKRFGHVIKLFTGKRKIRSTHDQK
jgi:hypothetical protein